MKHERHKDKLSTGQGASGALTFKVIRHGREGKVGKSHCDWKSVFTGLLGVVPEILSGHYRGDASTISGRDGKAADCRMVEWSVCVSQITISETRSPSPGPTQRNPTQPFEKQNLFGFSRKHLSFMNLIHVVDFSIELCWRVERVDVPVGDGGHDGDGLDRDRAQTPPHRTPDPALHVNIK